MTTIIDQDEGWHGDSRLAIGRALLPSNSALCAAELAAVVGMHQSNVKKIADRMAKEDLLTRERRPRGNSKPGRVPVTYSLASGERGNVEAILAEKVVPGALSRGQQLVIASIPGSKIVDLKRATARAASSSQMEWVALVDGEPQECLMSFDGDQAVDLANDLMGHLAAAEIDCRRATMAQVLLGHRFASQPRRSRL